MVYMTGVTKHILLNTTEAAERVHWEETRRWELGPDGSKRQTRTRPRYKFANLKTGKKNSPVNAFVGKLLCEFTACQLTNDQ